MTFSKKTLFSFLLGFGVLANILELTHVNFLYTSTLISFCTCILLPGFLISLILRIRKISFWENLLIIVGLSIAFLQFGGLFLNILLPLFGIVQPLAFQNLIIGFDVYILLLFILAWIRTKQLVVQIQLPMRSKIEKVLYALPVFFPIFATLGAIVLNNGGSNILTLILLGTIAFYSLLLVLFRDKIAVDLFPYAIFFIGIAILFTSSLRSWYISGADITIEYYIFRVTNAYHIWNMEFYQSPFYACLSITILPTILINLLSIQDAYVYKVIFPILFMTLPVLVFFIVRNYTTPVFAFLSSCLFMSFPTFFNDLPMGNRQAIGYIFFGLAMYMMLKRTQPQQSYTKFDTLPLSELSLSMRRLLFIIFGLGLIISHYSTNYIFLALLVFAYISRLIISLPFVKKTFALLGSKSRIKPKNTFPNRAFLSLPLILLLVLMTYVWNNLYTKSSGHAESVIAETVHDVFTGTYARSGQEGLTYSILFAPPKMDSKQQLQAYIQHVTQDEVRLTSSLDTSKIYSKSITDKYPTKLLPQELLPPTPLGNLLSSFHISAFGIQAKLRSFAAYFMQIFVFIGLLALFFLKNNKTYDLEYLLLCVGFLFFLALIVLLPALSVEYGVLRVFQQGLFVFSLLIVLGLSSILSFIKEQRRILFIGIIVIFVFLNLTGFISHLTGDYFPQMTVDNAGLYYNRYYTDGWDVSAVIWLSKNNPKAELVQSSMGGEKLTSYGNTNPAEDYILTVVILRKIYFYLEVSTPEEYLNFGQDQYVSPPKPFLDDNKNLLYSNGKVNIYK